VCSGTTHIYMNNVELITARNKCICELESVKVGSVAVGYRDDRIIFSVMILSDFCQLFTIVNCKRNSMFPWNKIFYRILEILIFSQIEEHTDSNDHPKSPKKPYTRRDVLNEL
jgi:hypothetical protein